MILLDITLFAWDTAGHATHRPTVSRRLHIPRLEPRGWMLRLFKKDEDYLAFERVLIEAYAHHPIPLLDWCLMRNHWHFVVFPNDDQQVTQFFRWAIQIAAGADRWASADPSALCAAESVAGQAGQERFKLAMERRMDQEARREGDARHPLSWPVDRPRRWTSWVDEPDNGQETKAIRTCVRRNSPLGDADWTRKTAEQLNLEWTLRPRGRPPKNAKGA